MKAALLVVLAVFGLALSIPLEDQPEVEITPFTDGDIDYRLNDDILPVRYDLEFTPYFANVTFQKNNLKPESLPFFLQETVNGDAKTEFTFDGVAKISFRIAKNTSVLTLHMNDLDIESYQFSDGFTMLSTPFIPADHDSVNGTDKWKINFGRELSAGTNAILTVNYKGYMRDDMAGFYRSYYYENGTKVWMASTQFERAEARRAFPCFDVSFDLTRKYFRRLKFRLTGTWVQSALQNCHEQTRRHAHSFEHNHSDERNHFGVHTN